jgi:2-polyprenyl-6-methoxyphenol hydroxylase-like FAD-dependent oxidoreductase
MMDYDVAIVGYGPTGMALATLLAQYGRKVVILERYTELYNMPRAAAFDDETMRTFQKLGMAEKVLAGTNIQAGYVWVNGEGKTLLEIEYENPSRCGWPAQYMMYQPYLEEVFDKHVKSTVGVEVLQGTPVIGISDNNESVSVETRTEEGTIQSLTAKFVVGCDGGGSFVRGHLNSKVDDYSFFENWLVCDFEMKRNVDDLPSFSQICSPAQPIAIVNIGPKHHRFSFRVEADADREELVKPENVWARVKDYFGEDDADLIRVANYTFVSLIVDKWRKGRVILAGDAAHQMPPFLAQGMVSGIRDARNLAWKLDMALSGSSETILDSYQAEREAHVRFITEKAIELGRVQTMRDPVEAKARDKQMIAARKANQKPEKFIYPPLKGGLIANYGDLLPQGLVSNNERTALLDDIVGTGWLIVASSRTAVSALSGDDLTNWESMGGTQIVFPIDEMFGGGDLSDTGGVYARWFAETKCTAAIVRPDSYVYGLAKNPDELSALLNKLLSALG